MEASGIGVMAQEAMRNQTFGAGVVGRTLDALNNAGPTATPVDGQTFGAAVVNKTLDYMHSGNRPGMNDMSQTYDFVKGVLGAHAAGRGALADLKI